MAIVFFPGLWFISCPCLLKICSSSVFKDIFLYRNQSNRGLWSNLCTYLFHLLSFKCIIPWPWSEGLRSQSTSWIYRVCYERGEKTPHWRRGKLYENLYLPFCWGSNSEKNRHQLRVPTSGCHTCCSCTSEYLWWDVDTMNNLDCSRFVSLLFKGSVQYWHMPTFRNWHVCIKL